MSADNRKGRAMPAAMVAGLIAVAVPMHAADAQQCAELAGQLSDALQGSAPADDGSPTSGGVIEPPPDIGTMPTITPPDEASRMPTIPDVRPQVPGGVTDDAVSEDAAVLAQASALLDAAKAAGERGDEAECRETVAEAEALLDERLAE